MLVRVAEGGAIVTASRGPDSYTVAYATVFSEPDKFADYMRAWFVAHHGVTPVVQLPSRAVQQ